MDEVQKIIVSDPVASLIRIENNFWLCIGEVNGLQIDGQLVDYVSFEMLVEETVRVSYQVVGLRPATFEDDPEGRNDWRTCNACFICDGDHNLDNIGSTTASNCPHCSPTVILDLTQGQRTLKHIGSHILYDPAIIQSIEPLCIYLAKGKGAKETLQINQKASKGCLIKVNFSYSIAAESTASSPCSNVPVHCPVCPKSDPTVWKYFMKINFKEKHKTLLLNQYAHLWTLSNFKSQK
ncbi:hypothetical protein BYT27DRAFT_7229300 [Phlegmacium glaucopus]|nr:hypothetical protein BYT27DRAFT_7229300 [Phlegmacium glaucopus]